MMVDHTIPTHLIQRLEAIAERKNTTSADVLENLLEKYEDEEAVVPLGTFAELAQSALEAGLSAEVDTARNSRQILDTEFADYIRRNMTKNENTDID